MIPRKDHVVPRVTHKALLRGHKPEEALKGTRPAIATGWPEPVNVDGRQTNVRFNTPDEAFAQRLGVPIREREIPPRMGRSARRERYLSITPQDLPPNDETRSKSGGATLGDGVAVGGAAGGGATGGAPAGRSGVAPALGARSLGVVPRRWLSTSR